MEIKTVYFLVQPQKLKFWRRENFQTRRVSSWGHWTRTECIRPRTSMFNGHQATDNYVQRASGHGHLCSRGRGYGVVWFISLKQGTFMNEKDRVLMFSVYLDLDWQCSYEDFYSFLHWTKSFAVHYCQGSSIADTSCIIYESYVLDAGPPFYYQVWFIWCFESLFLKFINSAFPLDWVVS